MDKRRQVWKKVLDYNVDDDDESLGYYYNDKSSFLADQVYSSQSTEKEKTLSCSDTYTNCYPHSSWEHLTSLLYEEDEMTAVGQARPFLPHRG